MVRARMADLDCVIVGGTDGRGGGEGPAVVLLHGFGAPGDDLVPLGEALGAPPEVRFVFPAAPIALPMGWGDSRAWWMIDLEHIQDALARGAVRDLSDEVPAGLPEARARIEALLIEVQDRFGVAPERTLLGGFSQGAMLSCDVALRRERPLGGLALLSGTLLAAREWAALAPRHRGMRVVQSHGTQDPLLPFALAERLRDLLAGAGLEVDFVSFGGAHEIPPSALRRLGSLVRRAAGARDG